MSKNYIYIQTSSEPAKKGDLTINGIIENITFNEEVYATEKVISVKPIALQPMLIMDAPDRSKLSESYINEEGAEILYSEKEEWDLKYRSDKYTIPFHSNDQVYKYLQSKGIKPASDLLIEFDGEVEIEPTECTKWQCYGDNCGECKRVAIIM